jgi:molybdopterin-dependent oxidoreductase alpha subunit
VVKPLISWKPLRVWPRYWKRPLLRPDLWVSLRPNGVGLQKPRHYQQMLQVAWANRAHPLHAWRILTKGACDGCSLGVAGLHDWALDGVHLCATRLRLLETNTADPFDPAVLADTAALEGRSGAQLRALGRLGHPMRRRAGEQGFRPITWDEAMHDLAAAIVRAGPARTGIYLTSRGITNEVYYSAAKSARAMGVANIDSAARVCHAPSTVGLRGTVGVAATTCSMVDVIESDLVVLWGANPANNQPVFMKYLYLARQRGCRVVVVNPYLEPGLDHYWVPSNVESALFGTRMCDLHVPVRPGGDVALANLVVKRLAAADAVDEEFVAAHTEGWQDLLGHLEDQDDEHLLAVAGVDEPTLQAFVDTYAEAASAILVWSMGITQHTTSVAAVQGIVNVALTRGNVGRDGAGLMPIRGHSGVQGGAEMGAYATSLPGGRSVDEAGAAQMTELWGFDVPAQPGLTAPEMLEAAGRGELDVLWSSGGNFLDVLPDPPRVRAALERVPLRIHQDIVLTSQMLVPGEDVILLPVATRYEQEGGGTETTTERRIIFSPEIPRRVGEARSEWRVFAEVAARVRPQLAVAFDWASNRELRSEIARVVPAYEGIQHLARSGDAVQWGGRHLCAGGVFPLPGGRARFSVIEAAADTLGPGQFTVATRRGKQFNSMIWGATDPLTGAGRDDVLMDRADADELGLLDGDEVVLRSAVGELRGRVRRVRLPRGSLQVHWPEGNVLMAGGPEHRERGSQVPDYNAIVSVHPVVGSGS